MLYSTILEKLANILRIRKKSSYHLLLASTISFTPATLKRICGSEDWTDFRKFLQYLGPGSNDQKYLLSDHLNPQNNPDLQGNLEGYKSLARLIKDGYFSTILTTNLDSLLEDALDNIGLRSAYQSFILGRDQEERIGSFLEGHAEKIRLIKLHGSLRESVLPTQFPDFYWLSSGIREELKRYINQDIIIVGSLERDDDIACNLDRGSGSNIYYALPHDPLPHDDVVKAIKARHNNFEPFLITGPDGEFTAFFQALEAKLTTDSSTNSPVQQNKQTPSHSLAQKIQKPEHLAADVLLVTVTETEANAILDIFPDAKPHYGKIKTYHELGIIGGARTFMVQSEMGSTGPGASLLTINDGIQTLSPSAIVMVGIAFGFNPKKQQIGDILVSRQLLGYELQRVGSSNGEQVINVRGDRTIASSRLLDRFRNGLRSWQKPPNVEFGLILSGAKLVDNLALREKLHEFEPEAIGGEMEGEGLYSAAQHSKVDWILVKAICDWADGNKDHNKSTYQQQAAQNAARFTIHVIKQGGLAPQP